MENIIGRPKAAGGEEHLGDSLENIIGRPKAAGGEEHLGDSLENTVISSTSSNQNENKSNTVSKIYKQHKLDGVYYANQILDRYTKFNSWKPKLETKKKDDLADCFLQGWWFITTKL